MMTCAAVRSPQPCGCAMPKLRITSTKLATVSVRWARAVEASLERAGSTRTALAASVGCTRQYIAKILDGEKQTIPVDTYLAVCDYADLDPNAHIIPSKSTPPWP